ncbi:MAG: HEAT repeat domain-containing protein [Gemmataceae bacterium]|nr:HEAT repeat domain-containing protein [Gemmataceae bacterium]MDW8265319.1 HEAT repeat domain-containing protein [Gemmataceae bacterium]
MACLALLTSLWANGRPDAPSPPSGPSDAELIKRLGHRDFQQREKASRALQARGPRVLPALRAALGLPDPEVVRRLNLLIPALERYQALEPKTVTFSLKHKPIRTVFDELSRQTGYRFQLGLPAERETLLYSFQFDQTPFWEAFDRMCEAAELSFQGMHGFDTFYLHHQETHSPYVCRSGAFRLVGHSIHHQRTIEFSQIPKGQSPARGDYLQFSFCIASEPKLALLANGNPMVELAIDDHQESMILSPEPDHGGVQVSRYGHGHRMLMVQTQVPLFCPSRHSTRVKLLKGKVPVVVLVDQKPVLTAEPILTAKGRKWEKDQVVLDIEDVTKPEMNGTHYQIKLSIRDASRAVNQPEDYGWLNSLSQRLELHDARGRRYPLEHQTWDHATPSSARGSLTFGLTGAIASSIGPPARLVYYDWITLEHQVPFEFRDLPLP